MKDSPSNPRRLHVEVFTDGPNLVLLARPPAPGEESNCEIRGQGLDLVLVPLDGETRDKLDRLAGVEEGAPSPKRAREGKG